MRLILEGPDNAGKTTLADTLRKLLPQHVYFHPGGRPADEKAEDACLKDQLWLMTSQDRLIMDRCTSISQQVYSPDPRRSAERGLALNDLITAGVIFVYCRPNTDWLMSFENFTWREGETEEFKQEIIAKQHVFIQRYDDLMQWVPHIHYDYRSEEAPTIIRHLVGAAEGNETSLALIKSLRTFEVPI